MIRNSFIILDRVGLAKERQIWQQDIGCWDAFIKTNNIRGIGAKSKYYYDKQLINAKRALFSFDSTHFNQMGVESWRLYEFFGDDAVFLDIEVTGVGRYDDITMIGLYDGLDTKIMIRGINLDLHALALHLKQYKLIVTFNGKVFDIPFLKKRYPTLVPDIPVIDLRHICRRIGLAGGLKTIEKQIGIKRSDIIEKFYGGDPYRLYRIWRATGDEYYLKLLIEYNEQDVVSLKKLMDQTYRRLLQKTYNPAKRTI